MVLSVHRVTSPSFTSIDRASTVIISRHEATISSLGARSTTACSWDTDYPRPVSGPPGAAAANPRQVVPPVPADR